MWWQTDSSIWSLPSVERDSSSITFLAQGVFHQGKELERVLSTRYRVTLLCFEKLPDPAWEDAMDSLYIIMPGFSAAVLPPSYILYQTEQACSDTISHAMGHSCLWWLPYMYTSKPCRCFCCFHNLCWSLMCNDWVVTCPDLDPRCVSAVGTFLAGSVQRHLGESEREQYSSNHP